MRLHGVVENDNIGMYPANYSVIKEYLSFCMALLAVIPTELN
jgi:hypothetical protein